MTIKLLLLFWTIIAVAPSAGRLFHFPLKPVLTIFQSSPIPQVFDATMGYEPWTGNKITFFFENQDGNISTVNSSRRLQDLVYSSWRIGFIKTQPLFFQYDQEVQQRYLKWLLCHEGPLAKDFNQTNSRNIKIVLENKVAQDGPYKHWERIIQCKN